MSADGEGRVAASYFTGKSHTIFLLRSTERKLDLTGTASWIPFFPIVNTFLFLHYCHFQVAVPVVVLLRSHRIWVRRAVHRQYLLGIVV